MMKILPVFKQKVGQLLCLLTPWLPTGTGFSYLWLSFVHCIFLDTRTNQACSMCH